MYLCHTPGLEYLVSEAVHRRVTQAYNLVRHDHPEEYNPVEKVPLTVYRVENEICIEPVNFGDGNPGGNDGGVGFAFGGALGQATEEKLNAILASVHRLDTRGIQWQQQTEVSVFCSLLYFFNFSF